MKKQSRRIPCGCAVVPLVVLALAGWWVAHELRPVSSFHRPVSVSIRPGFGISRVARALKARGLIRNERFFAWYAQRTGSAGRIRAGEYRLSPDMSPGEILARLRRGITGSFVGVVTVPPGYTLRQIADALAAQSIISDPQSFVKLARSRSPLVSAPFQLPKTGLEGYLYPETYRFLPNSRPERIAQTMLDTFTREFYDKHRAGIERSSLTLPQIVTVASMVEAETGTPGERARVAGVIMNRLRKGMRLQIDATVNYARGYHATRVMNPAAVNSPYNTYRHKGLPPGPIASPGLGALEAALNPERSAYLYYVHLPDGAHFARTEAEHNRNVARLRAIQGGTAPVRGAYVR